MRGNCITNICYTAGPADNLCVLCVSVVHYSLEKTTTEAQRSRAATNFNSSPRPPAYLCVLCVEMIVNTLTQRYAEIRRGRRENLLRKENKNLRTCYTENAEAAQSRSGKGLLGQSHLLRLCVFAGEIPW